MSQGVRCSEAKGKLTMKIRKNGWLLIIALTMFCLPGCATNRTRSGASSLDREQTVAEIPAHGGRKIQVTEKRGP